MKHIQILSILLLSLTLTIACTPTVARRGNIVEDFRIAELTPGISTRTNVLKSLGSPTTKAPFDENKWYYIGQTTEKKGIFDPKVVDEKVVIATFDEKGILQTLENTDTQRLNIPKVRRKTHTGGNEVTALEQIIGNIGKFNKSQSASPVDTGGGAR
jgi:outer membrane protein assembly factor BamE (lipoprotein component of BamABCDE complex)